jgi:TusA-related sulfurtransferase
LAKPIVDLINRIKELQIGDYVKVVLDNSERKVESASKIDLAAIAKQGALEYVSAKVIMAKRPQGKKKVAS